MRRIACLALLFSCLPALPANAEVRVLSARIIHAGDSPRVPATALAWDTGTGRLLAMGARELLLQRYPQATHIDVGSATVVPGLIDAHAHLAYLGSTLAQADLSGARSRTEVVQRLRAFEQTLAPGEWLLGSGWDQNRWEDGAAFPTAADLDAAFPERPVYLDRVDGHAGWANSAALRIAEKGRQAAAWWLAAAGRAHCA